MKRGKKKALVLLPYNRQNIIERSLTIDANNIIFLKKWHVKMKMEF